MKKGNLENLYLILLNLHDLISVWNGRKFEIRFEGWRNNGAITLFVAIRLENTRRGERAAGNTDRFLMTRDWWLFERSGEGAGATTTNRTRDWILLRTRSRFTSYLVSSWKPIFVLSRFVGKVHFLRGGRNNEVQTERSVGRKIKLERKK